MLDSCIANYFPHNKNYLLWLAEISKSGETYHIVSDINRSVYHLFKGKEKTGHKATNPLDLNQYII